MGEECDDELHIRRSVSKKLIPVLLGKGKGLVR